MKRGILYIIVAILALGIASGDALARAPKAGPVDLLGVSGGKFSPTGGQIDVELRSNMRRALTLVEGSNIEVEEGVCRVALTEPVSIEPLSRQVVTLRLGIEVRMLELLALKNTENVRVKFNFKYRVGTAKRLRTLRYETTVPTADLKKYMKI